MRAALRFAATLLLCCTLAPAQAKSGAAAHSAKERKPAAALRSECLDSVGLCVSVPSAWHRLANIFGDRGFVVAEPQPGADPATSPHLTVAAIDVSAKEGDGSTKSLLDTLVERMLTPEGALASAHVLERSTLLINAANVQIVRVGLSEEAGNAEAMESVALIEGDEGLVYSIALHCSSPDSNRLDPVFRQVLQSWRLQSAAGPASEPGDPAIVERKATEAKQDAAGPAKTKP